MKKKTLAKVLSMAMALSMSAAVFTGCDALADIPVIGDLLGNIIGTSDATVTISQTTASIAVGDTLQLTATASDGSEVQWESSDKTIVSVTKDGLIRGAKAGTATITAKVGDSTATCVVTVTAVDVTISQATATVEKDGTITLTAEAEDGGTILWSSSDESIATVKDGVVTGLKEGTVTITARRGQAGSATCEVTVVWSSKPADYATIEFGEEVRDAVGNPGTYYYWNDQGWVGTSVTAIEAYYGGGAATFQYSDAAPACWHGYQVFYKHPTNVAGKSYKLSAKITSAEEGDISINGTVVTLKKGDNNVEVYYTEDGGKASLSMQMGNQAASTVIAANTITIANLKFEEFTTEKLATPTAVSISADKKVSITDSNGDKADAIKLNFYRDGAMLYSFQMEDGDTLDDTIMEDGTYEVKAVAVGSGAYSSSDESAVLTTYTVANGGVSYDMEGLGESGAAANPGKWTYWTEFAGITTAKYENGKISFDVAVEGGNWYSNQLFYKNSALKAGTTYTLTMKMTSTVAGQITINGQVVTLVEGENQIKLNVTDGNVSISIQMGTMDSSGNTASTIVPGEFTIEDIEFTEGAGAVDPSNPNAAIAGGEKEAVANPDKVYYYTEFAGIAGATYENGTINYSVVNGGNWYSNQIFLKKSDLTAGIEYKMTLTLVSSVTGQITINGKVIDLVVGDNAVEVTYTEVADKASLSVQMGVNGGVSLASGDFTIKDLNFEAVGGTPAPDPDPTPDPEQPTTEYGDPVAAEISELVKGGEGDSTGNAGKLYYWYAEDVSWNCGSVIGITEAKYEENALTLTYAATDVAPSWFGLQVFYKGASLTAGAKYKVTLTIESAVAGDVTVNGKVFTLVAGVNEVAVEYTEAAATASLSIQMGNQAANTFLDNNTIKISNIAFAAEVVEGGNEGEEGGEEGGEAVSVTFTATHASLSEKAGKVYYNMHGTVVSEGTVEQIKAELLKIGADVQRNPFAQTGFWDGDGNDWSTTSLTAAQVEESAGTYIISYEITNLNPYKYTAHFNGGDFKPAVAYENSVTVGTKTWKMIVDPAAAEGDGNGALYWGCPGIEVVDTTVVAFSAQFTDAALELRDGVPCFIIKGTCTGYTEGKLGADFEYYAPFGGDGTKVVLNPTVTVDAEGNFEVIIDLTKEETLYNNLNADVITHLLVDGGARDVQYETGTDGEIQSVEYNGYRYITKFNKAGTWDRYMVLLRVEAIA